MDAVTAVLEEDIDMCAVARRAADNAAVDGVGRLALIEQPLWELYRYLGRQLGLVPAAP